MGDPQLPSVLKGSSCHSPPLFSQHRQSLLQREKGGRRESILLGTAVGSTAWSQGANLLALLGRSQPALGRENEHIVFTHPSKHGPPCTGTH